MPRRSALRSSSRVSGNTTLSTATERLYGRLSARDGEGVGQELTWFFRRWLNRPGTPALEGGWRYNPATKSVAIDLTQVQPGEPYQLPLEVGLSFEGSHPPRIVKIEMTGIRQSYELSVDGQPSSVVLDPNTGMLLRTRFGKR